MDQAISDYRVAARARVALVARLKRTLFAVFVSGGVVVLTLGVMGMA